MTGIRCPMCDYDVDDCNCVDRWGLRGKPGEERDIAEQLQIATELQTDKRDLERLCGDAKLEILRLRKALAKAVEVFDWQEKAARPTDACCPPRPEYVDEMRALVR